MTPDAGPETVAAAPGLHHLATLHIAVGPAQTVGRADGALRRVIPILGGTIAGPLINGTIMPGGADFQVLHQGRRAEIEARYVVTTDRDEAIYIENTGLRVGSSADVARLNAGHPVPPERFYFRTAPRFETDSVRLSTLRDHLYLGVGRRLPDQVIFDFFQVA